MEIKVEPLKKHGIQLAKRKDSIKPMVNGDDEDEEEKDDLYGASGKMRMRAP